MAKSKYTAEWKPNSINEAFWREVLVGRRILGVKYDGMHKAVIIADENLEMRSCYSLALDTSEIIRLVGEPDWGRLDLIAPAPAGPTGQLIHDVTFDAKGVAMLRLETGDITLDKTSPGRLWIEDGFEPLLAEVDGGANS